MCQRRSYGIQCRRITAKVVLCDRWCSLQRAVLNAYGKISTRALALARYRESRCSPAALELLARLREVESTQANPVTRASVLARYRASQCHSAAAYLIDTSDDAAQLSR